LLKEGGRLAFLTPREFFDARYGATIKKHLLAKSRIRSLVVFDPAETAAFEGVITTSAITLLERGTPDRQPVRIIHVHRIPSARQLILAINRTQPRREFSWGWAEDVQHEFLESTTRWSTLLPGIAPMAERHGYVQLGDIAEVKRGIATGANRFFVLSQAEAKANGLLNGSLRRVIARTRLVKSDRITNATFAEWSASGERVWLLDIRHARLTRSERAYIDRGSGQSLDERTICKLREPWYRMERRDAPPILATYMAKGRLRFILNDAKLIPLNVFHGIYPKGLSSNQVKKLLKYLNSDAFQVYLGRMARRYGTGLIKIEPRELATLSIPDVRQPLTRV
jgi:hypothetical protein